MYPDCLRDVAAASTNRFFGTGWQGRADETTEKNLICDEAYALAVLTRRRAHAITARRHLRTRPTRWSRARHSMASALLYSQ